MHAPERYIVAADAPRLQLCVVRRKEKDQKFPPAAITHRGGALPLQHLPFFTEGKKYRIPMFLATSFDINTAYGFWCAPPRPLLPLPLVYALPPPPPPPLPFTPPPPSPPSLLPSGTAGLTRGRRPCTGSFTWTLMASTT